jgi:hypothetical protein
MSWAARRRLLYLFGTLIFFVIIIGGPIAYYVTTRPATCFDSIQNQGETAPDKGGPCAVLDENYLNPATVSWERSFKVRDGWYAAVAYINNPNEEAGVRKVRYRFGLYDTNNVLVAEREGETFVMPGGVTPVYEGAIDAGNRAAVHTDFAFTERPVWERMSSRRSNVTVNNKMLTDVDTVPRLEARARNEGVQDLRDVTLIAVIFDGAGNAIATSQTIVPRLEAGKEVPIVFTWPNPFTMQPGQIDILPLLAPVPKGPVNASGN